jgi:vitamin B12/bleomycin/antimicrobial peptide transport system ATP-binding/permease protein
MDHLEITSPGGCTKLEDTYVEVKAGERILIVGQAGTGRTPLFRALAGLWPWGAGHIAFSSDETMLCIPRNAYLPRGTLREILAYPSPIANFAAETFSHALERLGLDHLVPMLDQSRRWERILVDGEQQSLAFARAVIHAPRWLLIDEVLDILDDDTRRKVSDVIANDLVGSGVIHIGRTTLHSDLFGRVLHLVRNPEVRRFQAAGSLESSPPPLTSF